MRLTTLFGYIATCAAAAYVVAVCTEDDEDEPLTFETLNDDEPVILDAEFVENPTS